METFIGLILCLIAAAVLVVAAIVWLIMRGMAPHRPASSAPSAPATDDEGVLVDSGDLAALDRLVARWAAEGRLDAATAAQVRELIVEEWQAVYGVPLGAPLPIGGTTPAASIAPAPAPEGPFVVPGAAGATPLAGPDLAADVSTEASRTPAPGHLVPAGGAPGPAGSLPALALDQAPVAAPRLARPSLGAALLALGTRRTLLFLGAFLLITSSLTLVVFSWASLPPIVQLAILAGTTAAVWAGGAWMARQPDLATAGRNLQVVAALLMPVVGFALGRPGLLNLAPRASWQLASALSLVVYLLAAWRTRRAFYGGAAALGAASLVLAAVGDLALGWQPVPLIALFAALLPLVGWLRSAGEARLASGPRWVALIGGPLALLGAFQLYLVGEPAAACAAALALGAVFCAMAYRLEGRAPWLWCAIALPAAALQVALLGAEVSLPAQDLSLALSALVYLGLSVALERRFTPALRPLFVVAMVLAVLAAPAVTGDSEAARIALPPLLLMGVAITALVERGRLVWLGANSSMAATLGLAAAAVLFPLWLVALLGLWLGSEQIGMALLPVAALYLAGARWWPGRLRRGYDYALQTVGTLVAVLAWGATLFDGDTQLVGTLLLALIFGGQAIARRLAPWAAASLGALAMAVGIAVERSVTFGWLLQTLALAYVALAYGYTIAGERLRRGRLAYWTWPAVIIGSASGAFAGTLVLLKLETEPRLFAGVILGLAALLGLHTALWRRAVLGYGVAPLLVIATIVAASEGFFTGWRPANGDLAYIVCALALALALLGQGLRRYGRAYALPYEQVAFIVLPAGPLLAIGDQAHLALTWGAMAVLYSVALWRYRLPWLLALAFVSMDLALLHGASWLLPAGNPAGAGAILATAVAAQALFCALARRGPAPLPRARLWGYLSAAIGGLGAVLLASGDAGYAAGVAGLLTVVLAVLVSVEEREEPAWVALLTLALALTQLHRLLGLDIAWSGAWLVLELAGVCLAGWAATWAGLGLWRRPTGVGAMGLAAIVVAVVGALSLGSGLPPLTFALVSLGLLLVTVAVRERELYYAYAAGASLVAAILCQLADWGFDEPQWYALPAGLYLLGLAWGLRRFQGKRLAAQLIEGAAAVLLLGLTFGQAVLGPGGAGYSLWLFGESLAVAGYGALARLRAPFIGGVGFFVLGALWIAVDAAQLVNQWVLLGAVGLLMVAAYVILERHQERLARAGRHWAAQLQSWG